MINWVYIKDNKVALQTSVRLMPAESGFTHDITMYDSEMQWDDEDKYMAVEMVDGKLVGLTEEQVMQRGAAEHG